MHDPPCDPIAEARNIAHELAEAGLARPFRRASPPQGRQDEIRADIMQASAQLFAEYGYSKTNISDIAQACDMSSGNLYRYFRNKQAIGHAVVAAAMEEEAMGVRALLTAPIPSEELRLRAYMTVLVLRTLMCLRRSPKIIELGDMIVATAEGLEVVRPHVMRRLAEIAAIIRRGGETGEFQVRDPEAAGRAFQMATQFFQAPAMLQQHGVDLVEDDLALTLDLLCAGLRAGAPGRLRGKP